MDSGYLCCDFFFSSSLFCSCIRTSYMHMKLVAVIICKFISRKGNRQSHYTWKQIAFTAFYVCSLSSSIILSYLCTLYIWFSSLHFSQSKQFQQWKRTVLQNASRHRIIKGPTLYRHIASRLEIGWKKNIFRLGIFNRKLSIHTYTS